MSARDNGGPAFPMVVPDYHGERPHIQSGMTLRDWFAGQALCGWAAGRNQVGFCDTSKHETIAVACYSYADAMLAARNSQTTKKHDQ